MERRFIGFNYGHQLSDNEIEIKLKSIDGLVVTRTKAHYLLKTIYSNNSGIVTSYPYNAEEILREIDGEREVKIYTKYSDGWGCIYENVIAIEILPEEIKKEKDMKWSLFPNKGEVEVTKETLDNISNRIRNKLYVFSRRTPGKADEGMVDYFIVTDIYANKHYEKVLESQQFDDAICYIGDVISLTVKDGKTKKYVKKIHVGVNELVNYIGKDCVKLLESNPDSALERFNNMMKKYEGKDCDVDGREKKNAEAWDKLLDDIAG